MTKKRRKTKSRHKFRPQIVTYLGRLGPHALLTKGLAFGAVHIVLLAMLVLGLDVSIQALSSARGPLGEDLVHNDPSSRQFIQLSHELTDFQSAEARADRHIASDATLEQELAAVQVTIIAHDHKAAKTSISAFSKHLHDCQTQLSAIIKASEPLPGVTTAAATIPAGIQVPILTYHQTPENFDAQLTLLEQRGYTTITMAQLSLALVGKSGLPSKPIAITFDDGYLNQMTAFSVLQQHHMTATYYIISGGERSKWCIGANRRYGDPLQPAGGCGDQYLSWDQIVQLDQSGVVTIGAHTVDHLDLATLSIDEQRAEIIQNKQEIESHLGHQIFSLAYPYGSFNAATVMIANQAGFTSAVSTLPGITQNLSSIYTLRRLHDVDTLP